MFTIKTACINDLPGLVGLFDLYRIFYGKESDLGGAEIFLSERMEHKESVIFLAESEKNEPAGFIQLYPVFSSTRMKRLWLLNDLFVKENFRGQGVSVKLIERAKELCLQTNACGLMLETAKSNEIGNALYPKTGFQLDGEHNFYFWDIN